MVRQAVKHTPANGSDLFSAAKEPALTSTLFWVQILTYRPLLVLGSLWLTMICLSAIAYNRLMFTEPTSTASPVTAEASLRPPSEALDAGISPTQGDQSGDQSTDPAATNLPANDDEASQTSPLGTKVILWGLMSLVGLCALGCVVISHQAKAAPKRRLQPKKRARKAIKPTPANPQSTGPKRLAPYSPQRDGVIVKGAEAVHDLPDFYEESLLPATPAPPPNSAPLAQDQPPTRRSQTSGVAMPPRLGKSTVALRPQATSASSGFPQAPHPDPAPGDAQLPHPSNDSAPAPHQPTVVPDDEAHPLDWPEASLAHSLDLRQQRSLSSFI